LIAYLYFYINNWRSVAYFAEYSDKLVLPSLQTLMQYVKHLRKWMNLLAQVMPK
jgi:hypothetical protein